MKRVLFTAMAVAMLVVGCVKEQATEENLSFVEMASKFFDGTEEYFSTQVEAYKTVSRESNDPLAVSAICGYQSGDEGFVAYKSIYGGYKLYVWDDSNNTHIITNISEQQYQQYCALAEQLTESEG